MTSAQTEAEVRSDPYGGQDQYYCYYYRHHCYGDDCPSGTWFICTGSRECADLSLFAPEQHKRRDRTGIPEQEELGRFRGNL